MCGIAGYIVTQPDRILPQSLHDVAQQLMLGIQVRGRDAAGYAFVSVKDRQVHMAKAPVQADVFVGTEGHLLSKDTVQSMPRQMIIHTRAWTKGKPSVNQNNHPLFSKQSGLCLVHNGWIVNDDELIEDHKLPMDAEVDTEAYLRMIDKFYLDKKQASVSKAIQEATKLTYGSIACAMLQTGNPDSLWVWRGTGQLFLANTDWGWVFASTDYNARPALIGSGSWFDTAGGYTELELSYDQGLHLQSSGKWSVFKLEPPTWESLPKKLDNRVTKVWTNGKLEKVTRARKSATNYTNYTCYDGEWYPEGGYDYDGYGSYYDACGEYRGSRSATVPAAGSNNSGGPAHTTGPSERQLPGFHTGNTTYPHHFTLADPSKPPEALAKAEAKLTQAQIDELIRTKSSGCSCVANYWCWNYRCCHPPKRYGMSFEGINALASGD